ncbi:ankyrin repeat domain-containing protein 29 isoform X3 [Marmota marmota marmota]|nr:ankyrin repeat domain-containing protein 29 isoform X3 [Marmota marmota marmota]
MRAPGGGAPTQRPTPPRRSQHPVPSRAAAAQPAGGVGRRPSPLAVRQAKKKEKETPLANAAFWAARRGNLALLKLLLNSGRVDVDCRDSVRRDTHGTTLLMVASYAGHIDCVRELVLQGADINLQRESGTTALFFAAQQGHNDVVRFLFGFGASTECRTKDGGTALLAASQYGHMQVVETLLKHGANIHDQLYDGATALFLAAQGGYLDVIRLLLSSGAKVNQPRQDGTAPLWIASQMGHSEVVRVMLLRGADRDATRNDGTTALLKAANKGYNDVIEELLKFSPTLGILKNGTSALHAAVLSGNIKTVALLLEAGADPALRNKANELPAELTKNERILRLLRSKEGHRKS